MIFLIMLQYLSQEMDEIVTGDFIPTGTRMPICLPCIRLV